jgi:MFS family permease
MTLAGALTASRLVARIGARRQLMLGPTIAATGLVWISFLSYNENYWTHMLIPLMLVGLGIGITFVPMTLTATAGLPPSEAGLAAGLVNTGRQIGGAIGLAVLATLAANTTHAAHPGGAHAAQTALTTGYDRSFLIAGLLLLLAAGLATLIRSNPTKAAPGPAVNRPAITQQPNLDPHASHASVEPAIRG